MNVGRGGGGGKEIVPARTQTWAPGGGLENKSEFVCLIVCSIVCFSHTLQQLLFLSLSPPLLSFPPFLPQLCSTFFLFKF